MSPDTDTTETIREEDVVDTTTPSSHPSTRKGKLELYLKNLLMQDMALRNTISTAKTTAKKKHFNKKLKKITTESKKVIAALRKMEDPNG